MTRSDQILTLTLMAILSLASMRPLFAADASASKDASPHAQAACTQLYGSLTDMGKTIDSLKNYLDRSQDDESRCLATLDVVQNLCAAYGSSAGFYQEQCPGQESFAMDRCQLYVSCSD